MEASASCISGLEEHGLGCEAGECLGEKMHTGNASATYSLTASVLRLRTRVEPLRRIREEVALGTEVLVADQSSGRGKFYRRSNTFPILVCPKLLITRKQEVPSAIQ